MTRGRWWGGEYDMRQSTPVSQSVLSSAHKSVGTAELRSGEEKEEDEEDTYDDETAH